MIPVLTALFGHWRRHRTQLATLIVGLAAATALWSGVQALNAEARASYARAAAVAGGDVLAAIRSVDGRPLALADYVALRRLGWKVSPVLEGDLRHGGASLRVFGIEPLTLPAEGRRSTEAGGDALARFVLPPHLAYAAPETVARLAGATDLPPREPLATLPPDTLLVDIGVAERLLGQPGRISRLMLAPEAAARPLPAAFAGRLEIAPPAPRGDPDRLSDSFHLNLTAFGLLSFVVGLFIVFATIGLAFEQRKPMFRTLRACGVALRTLVLALLVELVGLALVGGLIGMVLGFLIAGALLPDVAASLRSLYGARLPGSLSLGAGWWAAGLGMSLVGAVAAASASLWRTATLPLLAPAQPEAWRAAARRARRLQLAAAVLFLVAAAAALAFGRGVLGGFAVMTALLLGAALLLPALLAALLALGARFARRPLAEWALADARQSLGGLSLALMALMLALAVNVGVGTMVESFRRTFLAYLDQRLASEAYLTLRDDAEAAAVGRWLAARPEVSAVLPIWNVAIRYRDWPVELYGFRDHATYREAWPLIAALPGAWDLVAAGEGALVSEQLARRFGLRPGDRLELPGPGGPWSLAVAAIYPDYGNTEGQVMVAADRLAARAPDLDRRRLAVRADPAATARLLADLRAAFALSDTATIDQRGLKATSRRIFENTFAVTVALNALTLAVAGIALFATLWTLSGARLVQVAPLWAIGLSRRRLAALELLRTVGLAGLTALLALPLGLGLAWVLTAIVNVRAFGWRLPVHLFPGQWLTLLALALATAALASAWPLARLARASPLALLQAFSNER
jgi:putative ABC transport system permease protein